MMDFNPHSRTGSDGAVLYGATGFTNFNPHSRTGSDRPGRYDDRYYDRKTGSEKFGIIKAAQRGKIGTLTRCA